MVEERLTVNQVQRNTGSSNLSGGTKMEESTEIGIGLVLKTRCLHVKVECQFDPDFFLILKDEIV